MTVFQFLDNLVQEYRSAGLYTIATLLGTPLEHLKKAQVEQALKSIEQSRTFFIDEMKENSGFMQGYSRDLALLTTLQAMIEAGRGQANG